MRMRRMKNLDSRMEKCAEYRITDPASMKGNWRSLKADAAALWVEVGCGKGKFTAETAEANPDVLMIAVERCREAVVVAMEKAKAMGLRVHGPKGQDPDFFYGDAIPVTLKEQRTNTKMYEGMKVAFEGTITYESAQTVYVEDYDEETDMYYGMTVYYGFNLTGTGLEILNEGNRVAFVGSVQYYETGGTWQVSDIKYVDMRPNDPNNVQLISEGNEPAYTPITAAQLNGETVTMEVWAGQDSEISTMQTFEYAHLALSTSVSMENLVVTDVYTTTNEDSASKGAMTLTCKTTDGQYVSVRTVVLRDANGDVITANAYRGKTINVKGSVDYFSGDYQIKGFTPDDIEIVG